MSMLNKRRKTDIMKLLMSDFQVDMEGDSLNAFFVTFTGPKESPYEGGVWKIRVEMPANYPYKSPSIGFVNKIFHPNVDEASGSVCLDVINQTWSPMFDLVNIFEVFLPQLLLYPNPTDPLNGDAAALLLKDPERYKVRVKDHVRKYATTILSSPSNTPPVNGNSIPIERNNDGHVNQAANSPSINTAVIGSPSINNAAATNGTNSRHNLNENTDLVAQSVVDGNDSDISEDLSSLDSGSDNEDNGMFDD